MSVLIDIATGDPVSAAKQYQTAGYAYAFNQSVDAVSFDPAGHIYRFKATGDIVPSVTQILRDTGLSVDFEDLGSMGSRIRQAIDVKRDIGTAVHADAHAFDDDDLDLSNVHPDVRPYLDAWIAFRLNYPQLVPALRERLVYHPGYRYAGTLDGIFIDRNVPGDSVANITERWSVRLTPERVVPYRVTPYLDHYRDAEVFQASVTTWYAQAARRAA